MAVPTPTSTYLDLTDAAFTANGSPTAALGQHSASNTTYNMDGVNDYLTSSETPLSSGLDHSISFWMWIDTAASSANMIVSQSDTTNSHYFYRVFHDSTNERLVAQFESSATNSLNLNTSTSGLLKGIWHHILVTVDGTTNDATSLKVYIDGLESSYLNQTKSGTGWTGRSGTLQNLVVGAARSVGGNYLEGKADRIKYWSGNILSAAQVLEEYNNEFDAVIVPATTSEYLDLQDAAFTANGVPTGADDQHNPDSTYDFDATNDYLSSSETPFTSGSSVVSGTFWIKGSTLDGIDSTVISTKPTTYSAKSAIYTTLIRADASGGTLLRVSMSENSSFNTFVESKTAYGTIPDDADTWTHIGYTIDLSSTEVDIYINGVEASYLSQNDITGSPNSTWLDSTNLAVGSWHNDAWNTGYGGVPSRPKFWDNTKLSAAQINKEYDNEVAAIGEGFASGGILSPILSPIISPILNPII